MTELRRIEPLALGDTYSPVPNDIAEPIPEIIWVNPTELLVDESYQRELRERSITMIRRIVGRWSWRKFKPPIVTRTKDGYEVIDGQHTAIAAATHPGIDAIPIVVVAADTKADRADAFIGQNRDRLGITQMQLFFAAVEAKDHAALMVKHVCDGAGVQILKYRYKKDWPPRSTIAISALQQLVARRGAVGANRVMSVLAQSESAPIGAGQIKAVEALLFDQEYQDRGVTDASVSEAIRRLGTDADREASVFAATHSIPIWKALTIVYYRGLRQRRRAA